MKSRKGEFQWTVVRKTAFHAIALDWSPCLATCYESFHTCFKNQNPCLGPYECTAMNYLELGQLKARNLMNIMYICVHENIAMNRLTKSEFWPDWLLTAQPIGESHETHRFHKILISVCLKTTLSNAVMSESLIAFIRIWHMTTTSTL